MNGLFSKLRLKFFDSKTLSIRLVLFNISTIIGVLGGIFSSLLTLALDAYIFKLIAILLSILVLCLTFYAANWKGRDREAAIVNVGIISLVFFPMIYFTDGGLHSGVSLWFSLGVVMCFLLIDGAAMYIMLALQCVMIIGCYIIGYMHPEMVSPLPGEKEEMMHVLTTLFFLAFSIGVIFRYQKRVYKRSMEELEKAQTEAEASNKSKSAFLAQMSHEIRTPINAVLGMNEMILREASEENILTYASNAYNSGNALLSIINDILDISKIEAGRLEITETEYDLYSLVSDCYHMTASRAEKKGLEFVVKCDPKLPSRLKGDMFHIRQIVVNFITNAIKYTDKGHVELDISGKSVDGIFTLRFEVKDTGIGLRPESLEKLFTSFQRFDLERNQTVEGTGLGLSIAKQLAELMGGTVMAESVYGEGSTFICEVQQKVRNNTPVGQLQLDRAAEDKINLGKREKFIAPDARILAVDDVEMNLFVFSSFLKNVKIQIDTALSGKRAIELTAENTYDIIFMDHMMPEMDGLETFDIMRKMKYISDDTPVIMLTANAISGEEEKYLGKGFSSYLTKPVQSAKLEKMLLQFLPEDKIIFQDDEEQAPETADGDIPDSVAEFFDSSLGMMYNGNDKSTYYKVLEMYVSEGAEKTERINSLKAGGEWKDYITEVHALKGTSLMIGAKQLSEAAKELELAGKAGNYELINEKNGALMRLYGDVIEAAEKLLEEEGYNSGKTEASSPETLYEITAEELEGIIGRIKEACGNFDSDAVCGACDEADAFSFDGKALKEMFDIVRFAAEDFEYDDAAAIAEDIAARLLQKK